MRRSDITVITNGEPMAVRSPCTVADLLRSSGWRPTQVVVEQNGRVLPRSLIDGSYLQDGDRLEIIVPVAGG